MLQTVAIGVAPRQFADFRSAELHIPDDRFPAEDGKGLQIERPASRSDEFLNPARCERWSNEDVHRHAEIAQLR